MTQKKLTYYMATIVLLICILLVSQDLNLPSWCEYLYICFSGSVIIWCIYTSIKNISRKAIELKENTYNLLFSLQKEQEKLINTNITNVEDLIVSKTSTLIEMLTTINKHVAELEHLTVTSKKELISSVNSNRELLFNTGNNVIEQITNRHTEVINLCNKISTEISNGQKESIIQLNKVQDTLNTSIDSAQQEIFTEQINNHNEIKCLTDNYKKEITDTLHANNVESSEKTNQLILQVSTSLDRIESAKNHITESIIKEITQISDCIKEQIRNTQLNISSTEQNLKEASEQNSEKLKSAININISALNELNKYLQIVNKSIEDYKTTTQKSFTSNAQEITTKVVETTSEINKKITATMLNVQIANESICNLKQTTDVQNDILIDKTSKLGVSVQDAAKTIVSEITKQGNFLKENLVAGFEVSEVKLESTNTAIKSLEAQAKKQTDYIKEVTSTIKHEMQQNKNALLDKISKEKDIITTDIKDVRNSLKRNEDTFTKKAEGIKRYIQDVELKLSEINQYNNIDSIEESLNSLINVCTKKLEELSDKISDSLVNDEILEDEINHLATIIDTLKPFAKEHSSKELGQKNIHHSIQKTVIDSPKPNRVEQTVDPATNNIVNTTFKGNLPEKSIIKSKDGKLIYSINYLDGKMKKSCSYENGNPTVELIYYDNGEVQCRKEYMSKGIKTTVYDKNGKIIR